MKSNVSTDEIRAIVARQKSAARARAAIAMSQGAKSKGVSLVKASK